MLHGEVGIVARPCGWCVLRARSSLHTRARPGTNVRGLKLYSYFSCILPLLSKYHNASSSPPPPSTHTSSGGLEVTRGSWALPRGQVYPPPTDAHARFLLRAHAPGRRASITCVRMPAIGPRRPSGTSTHAYSGLSARLQQEPLVQLALHKRQFVARMALSFGAEAGQSRGGVVAGVLHVRVACLPERLHDRVRVLNGYHGVVGLRCAQCSALGPSVGVRSEDERVGKLDPLRATASAASASASALYMCTEWKAQVGRLESAVETLASSEVPQHLFRFTKPQTGTTAAKSEGWAAANS